MRLDQYLLEQGHFPSREKAKQAIESGLIKLDGQICTKPSRKIINQKISIAPQQAYVSRSAHKLKAALTKFQINPQNKICLDVGSSTGGFSQVLLEQGAKHVYAVDVGTDQMHPRISQNSNLTLYENTDIRTFTPPQTPELITVDVSFISLQKIIPQIKKIAQPDTQILLLFKPQFEVGSKYLKKGICKHPNVQEVIQKFSEFLTTQNLQIAKQQKVPLKGKEGNQEYFLLVLNFSK